MLRCENGSQTGGATSQTIEKLKGERQAIKSGKAANARLYKRMMTLHKHIAFALGLFKRMSNEELGQTFSRDGKFLTADEARAHIQELQDRGYKYYPCSCDEYTSEGQCMGWEEEAK